MDTMEITNEQTLHRIELTKNTKGYGWSIKVYDRDIEKAIELIKQTDLKLKTMYNHTQLSHD